MKALEKRDGSLPVTRHFQPAGLESAAPKQSTDLNHWHAAADKSLREASIPDVHTADPYIASVVDQPRVAVGTKSAAHSAALEVMPLVKEWAGNYLRGITPFGAYAKGTAVSLCRDIDLLIARKPIPGMEMRDVYWSRFKFLASCSFQTEALGRDAGAP